MESYIEHHQVAACTFSKQTCMTMALTRSSFSFRSKGLGIILIWNASAWIFSRFIYNILEGKQHIYLGYIYYGIAGVVLLLYPVFGWIADTYWGRYKTIRQSLFLIWLVTIAICLLSIIPDDIPHVHLIKEVSEITLVILSLFSLGGLLVNIFQFGIDQLPDASSANIISFTHWSVWMWNISIPITDLYQKCICPNYTAVAKLLFPVCMTLALCLDYNFNHLLIKEPASKNPLKLIYRVMRYAWKNKYPRRRSAFTYCEDKRYSRIDFAEQKFGGPFTTEQVEDVKTFWRILFYFMMIFLYIGFIMNVESVAADVRYQLKYWNSEPDSNIQTCSEEIISKCYQRSVYHLGYLVIAIVIPLHEFILHRFIERQSSFKKFIIGLFLALMSVIGCFSLELVGHIKINNATTNATCLLKKKDHNNPTLPIDFKWIMIPIFLRSFSNFFLITAVIQFICAQSPYSMKGLIVGIAFEFFGLSYIISYIVLTPITHTAHKWPPTKYGCGTWYLLSASIILLFMFVLACILIWKYKKRQRGDILPNEHIFAIDYYSRYTMYNTVTEDS